MLPLKMKTSLDILVVDDDDNIQYAIKRIVAQRHTLYQATNFNDARKAISSRPYDVVLLDHGIPEHTGYSLIPDIERLHPHCVIIGISSDPPKEPTPHFALDKPDLMETLPPLLEHIMEKYAKQPSVLSYRR